VLRPFHGDELNDLDLVRWGLVRFANLQWSLGDAERAGEVLEMLRGKVTDPGLRLLVDGAASASLLFENQLGQAVALSQHVLSDQTASAAAVEWAVFGGGLALALMGRGDQVSAVAKRGHAVESGVDGLLRCMAAYGEVRALALAGEFDAAAHRSAGFAQISSTGQYLAWGMANVLVGTVDLARGRFADTAARMQQAVAALTSESTASWSFPARLLLAQSYCALGRVEPGAAMVAELRARFGRHLAVFGPQLRIVEAWLAAAQGNVSGAIQLALDAAVRAHESGQRAIEMLALHDAVRFGDQSSLSRLVEVSTSVGGRLAAAIAAHATALRDRDTAAILAAAHQFEEIGALLSAADAAAQAAFAFQACGDRRRTMEAAAAAHRLAAECGGIRTPALDIAAHPLPVTMREREIANLVAAGLSNREIADQLVVSVRTVEGHLYRACIKLDISDREQLAATIRRGYSVAP
jgi:DNA-binding NarL/FixJ family response regulator